MATKITTHALDLARGKPAAGLEIRLYRLPTGGEPLLVTETVTNGDGRTDAPLLLTDEEVAGPHEIVFSVGKYLARTATPTGAASFLEDVPVRFSITAGESYHIPLLFSPWAYSTYRGS